MSTHKPKGEAPNPSTLVPPPGPAGVSRTPSAEELRERLAGLAHEQWSGWMRYLFKQCESGPKGTLVIPAWAVNRWMRQMGTAYSDLSDLEKTSDRKEADRVLSVIGR